jgi:hypothetical protein
MKQALLTTTAAVALVFAACTKSKNTVNTGTQLPAEAITSTTLNGGNVKGVMLADSTYTVKGDLTVLKGDTLTIQAGATVIIPGNHAFYIQGVINSTGTQQNPIVFTSPVQYPGQWGGFQCDSAQAVTFKWTKILWAGGVDSTGSTRQTISVSSPISVDVEDCWLIGGQDNGVGVYSAATVTILRNTIEGEGTNDGEGIDFHAGVTGTVAYNLIWGGAGSGIKVFTSSTVQIPQTNVTVYNNTCVFNGFRRGFNEPGRGILVDAFSAGNYYNNLLVDNYYGLDITASADYAHTKYGNNFFYTTIDSCRKYFYPAGSQGVAQASDIVSTGTGVNDPMFTNYSLVNDTTRVMPSNFDFHLKSGSPCIGKGNITYNADIGCYTSDGQGNKH